jgi:hypothetical protein
MLEDKHRSPSDKDNKTHETYGFRHPAQVGVLRLHQSFSMTIEIVTRMTDMFMGCSDDLQIAILRSQELLL